MLLMNEPILKINLGRHLLLGLAANLDFLKIQLKNEIVNLIHFKLILFFLRCFDCKLLLLESYFSIERCFFLLKPMFAFVIQINSSF